MLSPFLYPNTIEAGLDEVGRGCLAGPVVAAAVILPSDYHNPQLKDSKLLTKKQRVFLENEILEAAIDWAIAEVDNQKIDEINILRASFLAMHLATEQLAVRPEHLLVDGNRFAAYPGIPHTCLIKGDGRFMSIAAASVLAKNYRDDLMAHFSKTYPHYGWERNVGYPTKKHRDALANHGVTPLHRLSFRLL